MHLRYYTADDGQPTGGTQPPVKPAPATTGASPETGATEEKKFTQAEFEQQMKERLERQRRSFEAAQREKEAALEQQRLEDQKEFELLAKQRAQEINQLRPRADLAEGYEKRVQKVMDIATQHVAPEIQMILTKLSLPDQLDWLEQHLENISKAPPPTSARTDINAWTRTTNTAPQTLTDEEYRQRKRAESIYK